ncbi:MAG: Na+-dependent transporter [Planctomycetia bacterium 21-64-5]|nr:MAG: Na+-dependent transporter [Planctomycetia bacterium 21-64-5]HQU43394.1 bile acid:sodium symporter [Pirellulales bacterium]
MSNHSLGDRAAHFVHRNFLWFLVGSYAVATFFPAFGLWLRDVSVGQLALGGGSPTRISLSMLMLSFLLLNAGLGVEPGQLKNLFRKPLTLLSGLAANLLIPVAFIFCVSQVMRLWHNPDEVQNILVGLALVASMPIAGSSTAWSQNANGNMALSLGLVLFSTLLSPLSTPVALHSVGLMTTGDYSEDLHELASGGTNGFLAVSVILPSIAGIVLRLLLGKARILAAKQYLKLANFAVLFLLIYSNASLSLPQAVWHPDYDFLAVMLAIAVGLCSVAFFAGSSIARVLRVGRGEQTSLMFGLGMNNNGTGLVLASMALADHPQAMLPIIFYNLVQHLVAGGVDRLILRERPDAPLPTPAVPQPAGAATAGSGAS